jgi:hypothetical protein
VGGSSLLVKNGGLKDLCSLVLLCSRPTRTWSRRLSSWEKTVDMLLLLSGEVRSTWGDEKRPHRGYPFNQIKVDPDAKELLVTSPLLVKESWRQFASSALWEESLSSSLGYQSRVVSTLGTSPTTRLDVFPLALRWQRTLVWLWSNHPTVEAIPTLSLVTKKPS